MFQFNACRQCILCLMLLSLTACGGGLRAYSQEDQAGQSAKNAGSKTLVSAVRQGLKISTAHSSTHLTWLPLENVQGAVRYCVYRNNKKVASVSATSFTDSGLIPNTSYQYYITARTHTDSEYQLSDILQVSTRPISKIEHSRKAVITNLF